jgi:hypothetical protein
MIAQLEMKFSNFQTFSKYRNIDKGNNLQYTHSCWCFIKFIGWIRYWKFKAGEKNNNADFICDENGKYIVVAKSKKCQIEIQCSTTQMIFVMNMGDTLRLYEMF